MTAVVVQFKPELLKKCEQTNNGNSEELISSSKAGVKRAASDDTLLEPGKRLKTGEDKEASAASTEATST